MKCRTCGKTIVVFTDGWCPHTLDKPYHGFTQYHVCAAQGDNGLMLSKTTCRDFDVEYKEVQSNVKDGMQ